MVFLEQLNVVDCYFEHSLSNKPKDYNIGICYFSTIST